MKCNKGKFTDVKVDRIPLQIRSIGKLEKLTVSVSLMFYRVMIVLLPPEDGFPLPVYEDPEDEEDEEEEDGQHPGDHLAKQK